MMMMMMMMIITVKDKIKSIVKIFTEV